MKCSTIGNCMNGLIYANLCPCPSPFLTLTFSRDWRLFSQATMALGGPTMASLGVHLLGTLRDLRDCSTGAEHDLFV